MKSEKASNIFWFSFYLINVIASLIVLAWVFEKLKAEWTSYFILFCLPINAVLMWNYLGRLADNRQ